MYLKKLQLLATSKQTQKFENFHLDSGFSHKVSKLYLNVFPNLFSIYGIYIQYIQDESSAMQ